MLGVGRGPLVLLVVVAVLAGGLYGVAVTQSATADTTDGAVADPAPTAPPAIADPSDGRSPSLSTPDGAGDGTPSRVGVYSEAVPSAAAPAESSAQTLSGGVAASSQSNDATGNGIVLVQRFRRLPEEPGQVAVTYNYSIPDRVVSLRTAVPEYGNVTGTDGFQAVNETIYDWDEATVDPTITYQFGVNETGSGADVAANGTLLFADVGDWSLFRRPPTSTSWEYRGREPIAFDRRTATVGPGAAGDWLVYLGEGRLYTREASDETFRLVVPAAANMTETPDDVLDAMERASAQVDVEDPDERTFAVAAPTESVPWAVRGLSVEGTDLWVGDRERLNTTDNLWIHEYVHTLQDYEPTAATRWTREGFATYYAAVHALRHEDVTFEEFTAALDQEATANVTLDNPETWQNRSAYDRGALVAGHLDRRIRTATDGDRSLDAVLAGMNDHPGPLNATVLNAITERVGGNSTAEALRTAVTTDRPVRMWNRTQHVQAFGGMPPRIVVSRANASATYGVRGPYRNDSIDGFSPTVVTGETLVVDAEVRNRGGTPGYFDVTLAVDGDAVDAAEGQIRPNGSRRVSLSYTFDDPGEYAIAVGDETDTVDVVDPAAASIVGFEVSRTTIQQYETATVDVSVRNDFAIPARRTVTVRRGSHDVLTRSIHVGPNATTTAAFEVRFPTSGTTSVTIDDLEAVAVEVTPREDQPRSTVDRTDTNTTERSTAPSSAFGPGLGILTALIALIATVLVIRLRAWS